MQVATDDPLTRHKTLNYWRKRIAQAQAIQAGSDDVLCLTPDGLICETCRANVFLVEGRRLITPGLDGPLLPGVMRGVVLERARRLGIEVEEGPVPLERISTTDEAFMTNSLWGMLPIARLMDRELPAPGPVTRQLWDETLPWLAIRRDNAMTTVADVTAWLEQFAPSRLAEPWDNVGLTVGRSRRTGGTRHDLPDGHPGVGRRGDSRTSRPDRQPPPGALPRGQKDPRRLAGDRPSLEAGPRGHRDRQPPYRV